jgi:hypothetical protein
VIEIRRQDFDDAVAMGEANAEAIELTRRHCRHARIGAVAGNSPVGSMLGLPMGLLEVRCEHAPPPSSQGHNAIELAVEFYQANCTACPHRDATGEVPSLATVAAKRAAEDAARTAAAQRAAEVRARRHQARRERRHLLLAGEGHVVRDLADALDRIDRAEPRAGQLSADEAQASRQVVDAARGAPELFRPVLIDSLLELAADATDATAFEALRFLVRSGRCPSRRALEVALTVLRRYRSIDAGQLLAMVEPDLRPEDLPDVRGQPELTRQIVEVEAAGADQETRDELARVPWFLQRFREPWDASAPATTEAISFVVRRATGDWGEEAAFHSADHLGGLAREIPEAVAPHVDGILGAILASCAPESDPSTAAAEPGVPASAAAQEHETVAALERRTVRIRRDACRGRLAKAIGRCTGVDPPAVLASVKALFSATTGDARHDRAVRTTMLEVLEDAVSPQTLRDVLPITYTALLDRDQAVRRGGIDLWVACAGVTDSLPAELSELAVPLLEDRYVIVHTRMLEQIPRLSFTADLVPRLLPIVHRWVATYAERPGRGALEPAIWALRSLAGSMDDQSQAFGHFSIALAYVSLCEPHDRERLLTAWWPDELASHPAWVSAALATAASPELIDYYNQRREPLLQAFMDRPPLLAGVPLSEIEPLSSVHGPAHLWRALEPVELLQSAGRWADAAAVANNVEGSQPPGEEGAPGRCLAAAVARGAELARALAEGPPATELTELTDAAKSAASDLEASIPDGTKLARGTGWELLTGRRRAVRPVR